MNLRQSWREGGLTSVREQGVVQSLSPCVSLWEAQQVSEPQGLVSHCVQKLPPQLLSAEGTTHHHNLQAHYTECVVCGMLQVSCVLMPHPGAAAVWGWCSSADGSDSCRSRELSWARLFSLLLVSSAESCSGRDSTTWIKGPNDYK